MNVNFASFCNFHIEECFSAPCLFASRPVYRAPLKPPAPFHLLTQTHPEDGNDNVARNVEAVSTHDVASPQKPKLYDSMYLLLSNRKLYVVYDKSIYSNNKHIIQINRSLYVPI
jgi:hypothetical protein